MVVLLLATLWANPPPFSGDIAFEYLEDLVQRGHRYYGAPERPQRIKEMHDILSKMGWKVSIQSFEEKEQQSQKVYRLSNVIAHDSKTHARRVLLGSHWDTRLWAEEDANFLRRNQPITGANDGSSGVALLFALAKYLRENPLKHTAVDIVLFDGEEFGRPRKGGYCKGSEYFVRNIEQEYPHPIHAVVVLDMIADSNLVLEREYSSIHDSSQLWNGMFPHLTDQGIAFSQTSRSIRDDQSPFREKGIPSILLIDLSYPHWHTHQDTLDKCSAQSMQKVGEGLLSWLRSIDQPIAK